MSYIDKDEAIKAITEHPSRIAAFTEKAIRAIENLPDADVAEVVHAYWKETTHITISKRGREIHSKLCNCSNCDAPNGRKKSSYCHWCGAKMDGERRDT